ncbi:MAG: endonuclease III [Thermoplasmata archaeon]|nr:MAG: endonuclease III [Thermoplasmata archaeon]
MTIEHIDEIMDILKKELRDFETSQDRKWRKVRRTPFTVLISCILSLRTKDDITVDASMRLLSRYDTPEKILKASVEEIEKLIYPVGFYKTKARRIKEISRILLEKYDGRVPESFDELIRIKGIGRKTANIVMMYGFNKDDYLAIDTHCHRIPNRLGWISTKTPEETEKELKRKLPKKYWRDFNHLFVRFGQKICLPVSPKCSECPVRRFCKRVGVERHR